ncbi:MAG TPA: tetratricopeptide repeat protein [Pirellulales bacterium]|nr:tetratricopeptide repeat protein [Pirellulales bacterium]
MRKTGWPYPTRGWILAVGAGLWLLAFGLVWRQWSRMDGPRSSPTETITVELAEADELPVATAVRPPPTPTDGFVGSEACAKCHSIIAETYRSHPMSRSVGRVPGDHEVEDFAGITAFQPPGNRRYRVERTESEVVHHETMLDAHGEIIEDLAASVNMFIGSGTRGKVYAVNRGGLLFESLISWYGGQWGLSHGYEPLSRRNFERRIPDVCVMCHAGRMANVPGQDDVFEEPLFLETSIGCERCHGPGEKHVARREAGEIAAGQSGPGGGLRDDTIVNPASLDPARRESICNQCHLQGEQLVPRYGRTFYDFRPGQLLEEVWTVSVEGTGVRSDGMTKSVSQVQQMRESACYRGSQGRMSCNSCHPAHSVPESGTKADYYRGRCLECHAKRGCSLPEGQRAEPPAENSCVHCHMPRLDALDISHASQTDHRVGRSPAVQLPDDPSSPMASNWELFDHAEQRLARWEVDRVRGLNRVHIAPLNRLMAEAYYREAEALLRSSLRAAPDDVPALEALGRSLMEQQRADGARECLERVLQIRPRREKTLDLLAEIHYRRGELAAAIEYGERLLAVNPWIARYYARQADMLRGAGRLDQAIECGEKSLRLDPWQGQVRGWMVDACRDAGDESTGARHAEFLRRMRGG